MATITAFRTYADSAQRQVYIIKYNYNNLNMFLYKHKAHSRNMLLYFRHTLEINSSLVSHCRL